MNDAPNNNELQYLNFLSFDITPSKRLSEITADDVPPGLEPEDVAKDITETENE